MKLNYILTAAAALLIIVAVGIYLYSSKSSASSNSCFANAGEICPADEFLAQYKEAKQLEKEVTELSHSSAMRKLQEKSDQLRGMGQRLGQASPQGYTFDEKKMKFLAQSQPAPAPAPPPAAAPVPAPVPTLSAAPVKPEDKKP